MSNGEFASDLKVTREDLDEFNELEPIQEPITYYSESYDVFGLVSRLERGDIVIPRVGSSIHNIEVNPFQRGFVWKRSQMDKFIESLLLGYPTPSLFFVYQRSDRRLVVLDGQQRLTTLFYYKTGLYKDKKYRLNLSESPFDKLSYDELPEGYQRYLNNSHLSATVIRVEETPRSKEAVYNVFARLNSGGTQLTAHAAGGAGRARAHRDPRALEEDHEAPCLESWERHVEKAGKAVPGPSGTRDHHP